MGAKSASDSGRAVGPPGRDGTVSTVLLVDDHPLLRDGLRAALARDASLSVCGEAATLAEARRLVAELRPDVVLLDSDLPDGDGLGLVAELRAAPDGPKVVVLCGRGDPGGNDALALRLGASGFLSKRTGGDEVLRAVRDALGGRTYLSPETIERLLRRRGRPGGEGP